MRKISEISAPKQTVNIMEAEVNFHLVLYIFYYRPQRSFGKVIFSQASVILSTGWGACSGGGGSAPGGCLLRGVCLVGGSALGGAWPWMGCLVETPPLRDGCYCILVGICIALGIGIG